MLIKKTKIVDIKYVITAALHSTNPRKVKKNTIGAVTCLLYEY